MIHPSMTHLIPSPAVAMQYKNRKIIGIPDFDLMQYAYDNGLHILLEGPTGAGKTMVTRAFAAKKGIPLATIASSVGVDPQSLFGQWIPTKNGELEWADGPVTLIARHGGILLINEINFLPPRVASSLFGVLDGRRQLTLNDKGGEIVNLGDNVLVVADMNPGYIGTMELNEALRNRFPIKIDWGYDNLVEKRLVKTASLITLANKIRDHNSVTQDVPTNLLMAFEANTNALGRKFAKEMFLNHFPDPEERKVVKVLLETAFND